jgi:hypothetical protein
MEIRNKLFSQKNKTVVALKSRDLMMDVVFVTKEETECNIAVSVSFTS